MLAPHFGVFHLSLVEAGLLVAKCQWFRGDLKADVPEKDCYRFCDPDLENALSKPATELTSHLKAAVEDGSLVAAVTQRDVRNQLDLDRTYVEALAMADWLEGRGVLLGRAFDDEYLAEETALARKVAELVAVERFRPPQPGKRSDEQVATDPERMLLRHRVAELEAKIIELKSSDIDRTPVTEKQKSAYLNIIGGLLGLLLGKAPSGLPYSKFETQQAIIDAMHANYGEAPGFSQRNLADKFASGKRALRTSSEKL